MKPFKTFLYFAIVVVILSCTSFFLKPDYFFGKNLNKITSKNNFKENPLPDTTAFENVHTEENQAIPDSLSGKVKGRNSTGSSSPIYNNNLIYDSSFTEELQHRLGQACYKPVHILYFGDSQIEGDHISGTLRSILQSKFGGKGVGFIRIENLFNVSEGYLTEVSSGWNKSYIYDHNTPGTFSPLGFYATPVHNGASFSINRLLGRKRINLSKIGIYYSTGDHSETITLSGHSFTKEIQLPLSKTPTIQYITLEGNSNSIKLHFSASRNLKIHGLLFQNEKGIYVDNISMRGQIVPQLQRVPSSDLSDFIRTQNVGLVILHYGVNLVPGMLKSYAFYTRMLKKQIQYIRETDPTLPILIVGVSDMAHRNGTGLTSYPNISAVRTAQRNAAKQKGIAFWNLEKDMGGKNSMIRWVRAIPTLATKDYVHFNRRGADSIGRMLSRTIFIPLKTKKQ